MGNRKSMSTTTFFTDTKAAGSRIDITFDDDKVGRPKYALGYWSIRGLGAPLTMMLCAAKIPFTLFLYDLVEDEKGGWTSDYFSAKKDYIKECRTPLWNLPFFVDRDNERVICQTNAVFATIGRVCGMHGSDENTTSQCEQLLCELYDLRNIMFDFCYVEKSDVASKNKLDAAKNHFKKLEAWLEMEAERLDNGEEVVHLVGGKFNAPDFHLYEMLDQFEAFAEYYKLGDFLNDNDFKRLKAFKQGFSSLDENQFYLKSWLHTDLPFNNCMSQFGSLPGPATYTHSESASSATWRDKGLFKMKSSDVH